MLVAVQPCNEDFFADPKSVMEKSYWRGADMIELRLDFAEPGDWARAIEALALAPCHLIVTCRRKSDGGLYAGNEAARLVALGKFAEAGARYVDIESDVENADTFVDPPSALRSFHNMEATNTEELFAELERLKAQSAFNVKFATRANSLMDNLVHREVLQAMQGLWLKASFCMGFQGMPSRLLQPMWGGDLVYCAAHGAEADLPDLPTLEELVRVYRMKHWYRDKTLRPALYGLVGKPIRHSLSPKIHNGFFARHKVNAFYVPLESDEADEVVYFARELDFKGLSVTTPLKETIAEAFGEPQGIYNTVRIDDGNVSFANTDIAGFREDLRNFFLDHKLPNARVLILGSGGAAYAAATALHAEAGELLVHSRNARSATLLASKLGIGFHPNPIEDELGFDLVVNATPCGTPNTPLEHVKPVAFEQLTLNYGARLYTMVVGAPNWDTSNEQAINLKGVRDGRGMLVKQAVFQQGVWRIRPAQLRFNDLRISIVGFRGVGKTTNGRKVAEQLGVDFIDLDEAVAERTGLPTKEFFEKFGEAAFREIESDTLLKAVEAKANYVLACGGGVAERAGNLRVLYEHTHVIHLVATQDQVLQNLMRGDRPSVHLDGIEGELREVLPRRHSRYSSIRDAWVKLREEKPSGRIKTTDDFLSAEAYGLSLNKAAGHYVDRWWAQ